MMFYKPADTTGRKREVHAGKGESAQKPENAHNASQTKTAKNVLRVNKTTNFFFYLSLWYIQFDMKND